MPISRRRIGKSSRNTVDLDSTPEKAPEKSGLQKPKPSWHVHIRHQKQTRSPMVRPFAPRAYLTLLVVGVACLVAPPTPAKAAVFFGFGAPFYYPPPVYYPPYYPPPPVYYPPPVVYAPQPWSTPPQPYPRAGATTCYAGRYVCPMQVPIASGGTCWCPDNTGGRAYGRAS